MSRLRAKCPDCRTLTAVALGPDYQCHSCGREFEAGLVRVPRAWGAGGDAMVEAALLPLPYPEASVIAENALGDQTLALATDLPERPVLLGGCCCAHVGAVEGLAARHGRIGLVWFDAHGDLNTAETSPSGNAWGMALRMVLDSAAVETRDTVLIGARNLDPPEEQFIAAHGLPLGHAALDEALGGTEGVYVAFDCDALDADDVAVFLPEPGGIPLTHAKALLTGIAERAPVLGVGFTGLAPDHRNVPPLTELAGALGL